MNVSKEDLADLERKILDRNWRIRNLYLILNEDGIMEPFVLRDEQETFDRDRHNRNKVPKARKLGMSTFIDIDYLDRCLFTPNFKSGVVDLTEQDAFAKLDIARFAWENGPFHPDPQIAAIWRMLHRTNSLLRDSAGSMEWKNGSQFTAGVSYTGKTPQALHVSELGPISVAHPRKAEAIRRGSMNAVPPNGLIDVETTMEGGRWGVCYEIFKLALDASGKDLTPLDWKLHFFPWHNHPSYVLPGATPTNAATLEYFAKIEEEHGLTISPERQAWYEAKKREQGENMWQQFPTVVEECDRHVVAGQIFPEMVRVRVEGRVRDFKPEVGPPLFTCWDIGASDNMAGWCVQPTRRDINWIDWAAGEGAGAAGMAAILRRWEAEHGDIAAHLLPHDAEQTDKGSGRTFVDQLTDAGIPRRKIVIVPRIPDKWVGIDEARKMLPESWFHSRTDEEVRDPMTDAKLPSGVGRLEGYRKKIDTSTGETRSVPVGDICSHTADALRTFAEARAANLIEGMVSPRRERPKVLRGYRGI